MSGCATCGLEQGHCIGDVGFLRPVLDSTVRAGVRTACFEGRQYEIFSECGTPRVALLQRMFRQVALPDGWRPWATPYSGAWHRICFRDVNWATSNIPSGETDE